MIRKATTMKTKFGAAALLALAQHAASQANCSGTFEDISAADFIAAVTPGWNLGNTLDATPDEGSWNNAPVVAETFDLIKEAGFKSVRIPVTYTHHFLSEAPDYEVDPDWLQRVSDVVDMALERDLYVVTNIHHDSWEWADISLADADVTAIQDKFYALWYQIGSKLGCKSSSVAFETINEPPAETAEDGAEINQFNEIFLEALADSGGFNSRRVVTLTGGGMDATKTTEWFEPPANITNPWALQFHYYNPYDFTFSAWGKTIWGSDADKDALDTELGIVRGNFTDVPLYIGEFDASPTNTESAARWKWFDYFTRSAQSIGAAVVLWDNGLDHLNRDTGVWRDPTAISIVDNAIADVANSLPDSTVDASAEEQFTSAYIFHRVGNNFTDQELPWLFNGNTLSSVSTSDGTELTSGTDYTVSDSAITFASSFISSVISANSSAGVAETLTLSFSAGADVTVEVVQWATPVLASTSSTAVSGSDLAIPVEWQGLDRLATVKMITESGVYLVDDWTQYLGPLQQARGVSTARWMSPQCTR